MLKHQQNSNFYSSLLNTTSNTPLDFSLDVPNQGQVSQSFDLSDFEADLHLMEVITMRYSIISLLIRLQL